MITVREVMEILGKFNPDAIIRLAQPDNDFSENCSFIEEMDGREVHFCNTEPHWASSAVCGYSWSDEGDCWIEVLEFEQGTNFGRIKTHRTAPPKLSA